MSRRAVPILLLVMILTFPGSLQANPTAPQVVSGAAAFAHPDPQTLQITNSASAIINWGQFSIQAGEITRFAQPSEASAVLNRVVGGDPSAILGQLQSNGHVFLINPHGMVFGPDAVIDTAGFVASTLDITDEDFLQGRLAFNGGDADARIVNQGFVSAGKNGDILLIAPNIVNSGTLRSEGGNLLLAAGRSITLTSLDVKGLHFEVQAPEDSVVNLGKILAENGAAGIFAGTLENKGEIRAAGAGLDETGAVVLHAAGDITLGQDSQISADGPAGGLIHIESADGTTLNSGGISATGAEGTGGKISLLGDRVGLLDGTRVDASGWTGGGEIFVGGGFQGKDPEIANALAVAVTSDVAIRADALSDGDGGRVILWSDGVTNFYGQISARGGSIGGDGGFVEVSGKQSLAYRGRTDTTAPAGSTGTLLLDPASIVITGGTGDGASDGNGLFSGSPGGVSGSIFFDDAGPTQVYESEIEGQSASTNIFLQATDGISVSGTFPDGAITLSADRNFFIETTQTADPPVMTGIDLTGATTIGPSLLIKTQGTGTVSIITGGTAPVHLCRIETYSGDVTVDAGGDIIFGIASHTNIVSNSGGDVILTSNSGQIVGRQGTIFFDNKAVETTGLLILEAATGIRAANIGEYFQASGEGNTYFSNSGAGTVRIWSQYGETMAGFNTGGDVYLKATGDVNVGTVNSYAGIVATGAVQLDSGGRVYINQPISGGAVTINAVDYIEFGSSGGTIIDSTGNVDISADGIYGSTSSVLDVDTPGDLTLVAQNGIMSSDGGAFQISGGEVSSVSFTNGLSGIVHLWSQNETLVEGTNASGEDVQIDVISGGLTVDGSGIATNGDLYLHADAIDIAEPIDVGTNTVEIGPITASPGTPNMSIGGSAPLDLDQTELGNITADYVSIGTSWGGFLTTPNLTVGTTDATPFIAVPYGVDLYGESVTITNQGIQADNLIQIFADDMDIQGPVVNTLSGSGVVLKPLTTLTDIFIEGADTNSGVSLFPSELDFVTTNNGYLQIGNEVAWVNQDIYVTTPLASADINATEVKFYGDAIVLDEYLDFSVDNETLRLFDNTGITIGDGIVPGIYGINAGTGNIIATGGTGRVTMKNAPTITAHSFQAKTLNIDSGSGTVTLNATTQVEEFSMSDSSSRLQGTGSLMMTGINSLWNDGTIDLDVTNTGTLSFGAATTLYYEDHTFTNTGTVNWEGFEFSNSFLNFSGTNPTFNNSGTLNWNGYYLSFIADNPCVINNQAGGIIQLNDFDFADMTGALPGESVCDFNNAGTLIKSSGAGPSVIGFNLVNTGMIDVQIGTLDIQGSTFANDGIIKVGPSTAFWVYYGSFINNADGILTGKGTFRTPYDEELLKNIELVNYGTIRPGASPGILEIDGDLKLDSSSILDIDIGGTTAGTQHDQIQVTGALYGGGDSHDEFGTLKVYEINGYTGNLGDDFTILTATGGCNTGTFNAIQQTSSFDVTAAYDPGNIILTVSQLDNQPAPDPPPPPTPDPFNIWTLGTSGSWNVASNWSYNSVPDAGDDVKITDGRSTVTLYSGDFLIGSLLVGSGNGLSLLGGSLTLGEAATVDKLTLDGGTLIANQLLSLGTLSLGSGSLAGSGDVAVSGRADWTGGAFSGAGRTEFNGGLYISGDAVKTISGGTLVNNGALDWSGSGQIVAGGGAVLENPSGATFRILNSGVIDHSGSGALLTIQNEGTIAKSTGGGAAVIEAVLNNTGSVKVQAGTLRLTGGGASSGAFNVTGEALEIGAGVYTFNTGTTVNGHILLSGGTLSVPAAVAFDDFTYAGGLLQVNGTATVDGDFAWVANEDTAVVGSGNGRLNLAGTASFSGAGAMRLDGITVNNTGDLTYSAGTFVVGDARSATFNNAGTFQIQGDVDIAPYGAGGTFTNSGTLQKTGGSGTSTFALPLDNTGTAGVASGTLILAADSTSSGLYSLASGATLALGGAAVHTIAGETGNAVTGAGILATLSGASLVLDGDRSFSAAVNNAGTLSKSGGTGISLFTGPVANAGSVIAASGTMAFRGGYTQSAGSTRLAGGNIEGDLVIDGGILTGSGTLDGNLNNTGGTVTPGASPGTLIVSGDFTQGPGGTLTMEVGGQTPGTEHDVLAVLGTANLGGTLNVVQYGGFVSNVGDTFGLISYNGVTGDFATVTADSGFGYSGTPGPVSYQTLTTVSPSGGGTTPGDGGTTPGDGGTTPGDGGTTPGDGGTTPGDGGTTPGDGGSTPGDGGTTPGGGGTTSAGGSGAGSDASGSVVNQVLALQQQATPDLPPKTNSTGDATGSGQETGEDDDEFKKTRLLCR